jgi:hypothetical protein
MCLLLFLPVTPGGGIVFYGRRFSGVFGGVGMGMQLYHVALEEDGGQSVRGEHAKKPLPYQRSYPVST